MSTRISTLKEFLKEFPVPLVRTWFRSFFAWRRRRRERIKYEQWIIAGRSVPPPPLLKQETVRSMARSRGIHVLVETGTFEGEMVESVASDFDHIYTIELDPILSASAAKRFKGQSHIHVLKGNSGEVLPRVLKPLKEPAVFWLDAHYSGGATARGSQSTPVMTELAAIGAHGFHANHVILIDDAREFSGADYPSLAQLRHWAKVNGYDTLEILDDIIRIYNATPHRRA